MSKPFFTPGALWSHVLKVTKHAQASGALHSIATNSLILEHTGIQFLVRMLTKIEHKEKAKKIQNAKSAAAGKAFNPFLPYEKDLFVADISATHLALLNKFNVMPHHLLIVTRAFEEQEAPLNLAGGGSHRAYRPHWGGFPGQYKRADLPCPPGNRLYPIVLATRDQSGHRSAAPGW